MPQRKCTRTKEQVKQVSKRIVLPIGMEMYKAIEVNRKAFRNWVDEMIGKYPELFPSEMAKGYTLHDRRVSRWYNENCGHLKRELVSSR